MLSHTLFGSSSLRYNNGAKLTTQYSVEINKAYRVLRAWFTLHNAYEL